MGKRAFYAHAQWIKRDTSGLSGKSYEETYFQWQSV